jgi:hypothetical protein
MLPDSSILRPSADPAGQFSGGGAGGHIQRIDVGDVVVWDYYFSNGEYQHHHDIQPMQGGTMRLRRWSLRGSQPCNIFLQHLSELREAHAGIELFVELRPGE